MNRISRKRKTEFLITTAVLLAAFYINSLEPIAVRAG